MADGRFEVVERPEPSATAGQVVVAVERCGVCGSDLHLHASGMLPPGAVLGHEFGGTVVDTDPQGGGPPTGQRVAVLPARRCGVCPVCMEGRGNLCALQLQTSIGLGWHDGGYAERVVVPASSCHVVPTGASPAQLALAEPYAVALHAIGRSRVATRADHDPAVAVIGAGSVGLMCVAALKESGVTRIVVAEPRAPRAEAAAALGAAPVDNAADLSQILGQPPDVVFEATGAETTPGLAVEVVAAGGQVVLLGVGVPGGLLPMPGLLWVVKEVDVAPSIAYTDAEFARAVEAVAGGVASEIEARAQVRALSDVQGAFDDLRLAHGPVKVLLDPSS